MRRCDGCRFCCWAWNVPTLNKKELSHCRYECLAGCAVHSQANYPSECSLFNCPYLEGKDIHRPDNFQETLEELKGNIGNYIPTIPTSVPIEAANQLIKETRTLPASFIKDGRWMEVVLPLDRNEDGGWVTGDPKPWNELANVLSVL